ncbi:hypothetical protein SCHPADRAFT_916842 [Schizopora paradoxa]|uniref:Integrase core domain-containing protein n=1 Tax=Schizopora paradoxa TaxID=27342 RepID=A0A0H2RBK9_9AGAM|nr:hypothetical protein SCHPADRAFT_916842 [Schizopora paradoxa]
MEQNRGRYRGSYIWGRSVHNNRAERLWYDVNQGYNHKWKEFFMDLEANEGLNVDLPHHKWLLHYLFHRHLNFDASEWVEAWNAHILDNRGERGQSPREMFMFGMLEEGPRGIDFDDNIGDVAEYGVDWEGLEDQNLMGHLLENNPHEHGGDLLNVHAPAVMNEVVVLQPNCPFTVEQLALINDRLRARAVNLNSTDMLMRRRMWIEAFDICNTMW